MPITADRIADDILARAYRAEETDSTSAWARREIEQGTLGDGAALFIAERQTNGRGRFTRSWVSPSGGLWCTLAWPYSVERAMRALDGLGLRIGVACVGALRDVVGGAHAQRVRLKWPNDALIDGGKCAGVLVEALSHGGRTWALVGVGVNANNDIDDLPDDVRARAATLRGAVGGPVNLDALARTLVRRLSEALSRDGIDPESVAAARDALFGVGMSCVVTLPNRRSVRGVLAGLRDDGAPVFNTDEGEFVPPRGVEITILE